MYKKMNGRDEGEEVRPNISVLYHHTSHVSALRAQYRKIEDAQQTVLILDAGHCSIEHVETDGEYILSAGPSHHIDVWDASIGAHLRSLTGGHRMPVTGLALMSASRSQELARRLGCSVSERIVVSASLDTTIVLWSLHSGQKLKCLETDSSITCFGLMNQILAITGSCEGKLDVRHLGGGNKFTRTDAHSEAIDAISIEGLIVCTASFNCPPPSTIKIWQLQQGRLSCLGSSTNDLEAPCPKPVGLALCDDVVALGDSEGPWVHLVNWRSNRSVRLKVGGCDRRVQGLRVKEQLLLVSSRVEGESNAVIEVYLFPDYEHLCTLGCKIEEVRALTYAKSENNVKFILGGTSLHVLDFLLPPDDDQQKLPALKCKGGRIRDALSSRSPFTTKSTTGKKLSAVEQGVQIIEKFKREKNNSHSESEEQNNKRSSTISENYVVEEPKDEAMDNPGDTPDLDERTEMESTGFSVPSGFEDCGAKDCSFACARCSLSPIGEFETRKRVFSLEPSLTQSAPPDLLNAYYDGLSQFDGRSTSKTWKENQPVQGVLNSKDDCDISEGKRNGVSEPVSQKETDCGTERSSNGNCDDSIIEKVLEDARFVQEDMKSNVLDSTCGSLTLKMERLTIDDIMDCGENGGSRCVGELPFPMGNFTGEIRETNDKAFTLKGDNRSDSGFKCSDRLMFDDGLEYDEEVNESKSQFNKQLKKGKKNVRFESRNNKANEGEKKPTRLGFGNKNSKSKPKSCHIM